MMRNKNHYSTTTKKKNNKALTHKSRKVNFCMALFSTLKPASGSKFKTLRSSLNFFVRIQRERV